MIELVVTMGLLSIISLAAFMVLQEGLRLYNANQRTADAQTTAVLLLSRVTLELVNANSNLVHHYGPPDPSDPTRKEDVPGIVFASPLTDDGEVFFHPETGRVLWQKFVCFYYDKDTRRVIRRETELEDEYHPSLELIGNSDLKGTVAPKLLAHPTSWFKSQNGLPTKTLGHDVDSLQFFRYDAGSELVPDSGVAIADPPDRSAYDVRVELGDESDRGPNGFFVSLASRVSPRG